MLEWKWALAVIAAGEFPQFLHVCGNDPEDENEEEEEETAA